MKGLLLKDLMLHRKMMRQMLFGYVFFGGFAVLVVMSIYYGNFKTVLMNLDIFNQRGIRGTVSFISFCVALMGGYMATSVSDLFTQDQKSDFGKVSYSLPVSDRERISARYGMYGICLGSMLALSAIIFPVLCLASGVSLDKDMVLTVLAGFFPGTIFFLVGLPFIYRFGTGARIIVNAASLLITGLILLHWVDRITGNSVSMEDVLHVIVRVRNLCAFLFVVMSVPGFLLSGFVSMRIMRREKL